MKGWPLLVLLFAASPAWAGGGGDNASDSGAGAVVTQPVNTPSLPIIPALTTGTQYYPVFAYAPLSATSTASSQNTARCTVFYWNWTAHIDRIGLQVSTAGTGPLNIAIYTDAIDATKNRHQPQALLTDPSLAIPVTATGAISIAVGTPGTGIALPAGLYWVCMNDANAGDAERHVVINSSHVYMGSILGGSTPTLAGSANSVQASTIAVTAGTTTTNWPSFAGQTFTDVPNQSAPAIALEIATVP